MRRVIDLLLSREDIDPSRLGYVGFSWGGSEGAIFAGVERRVSSFVLMSAVPRLSADMRRLGEEQGANDLAGYEEAMRPIDAVNYLPHAAPNALFFQFGKRTRVRAPTKAGKRQPARARPNKLAGTTAGTS